MPKSEKKAKVALIPADVMAELNLAEIYDRSTGDLNRQHIMLPGQNSFFLSDDLEPVAKRLADHYGLNEEQGQKAAQYLAALPAVRQRVLIRIVICQIYQMIRIVYSLSAYQTAC